MLHAVHALPLSTCHVVIPLLPSGELVKGFVHAGNAGLQAPPLAGTLQSATYEHFVHLVMRGLQAARHHAPRIQP